MNSTFKVGPLMMEMILGGRPSTKMIVRCLANSQPNSNAPCFPCVLTIFLYTPHYQPLDNVPLDTNDALHYYSHDNAITRDGVLSITTEQKQNLYKAFNEKTKKFYVDSKYIQSAMLQGWNKFCITGGIVEFSAKLPGDPSTGGLWPARTFEVFVTFWSLVNNSTVSDTFLLHPFLDIFMDFFILTENDSLVTGKFSSSILRRFLRFRVAVQLQQVQSFDTKQSGNKCLFQSWSLWSCRRSRARCSRN